LDAEKEPLYHRSANFFIYFTLTPRTTFNSIRSKRLTSVGPANGHLMRIAAVLVLVFVVFHGVPAQSEPTEIVPSLELQNYESLSFSDWTFEAVRQAPGQPISQSISLNLIPKWLDVKAFYIERRQPVTAPTDSAFEANSTPASLGRYFDVLAS